MNWIRKNAFITALRRHLKPFRLELYHRRRPRVLSKQYRREEPGRPGMGGNRPDGHHHPAVRLLEGEEAVNGNRGIRPQARPATTRRTGAAPFRGAGAMTPVEVNSCHWLSVRPVPGLGDLLEEATSIPGLEADITCEKGHVASGLCLKERQDCEDYQHGIGLTLEEVKAKYLDEGKDE